MCGTTFCSSFGRSPLDSKELRSYEDGGSLVENVMMIEDASNEDMPNYEGTEVDRTQWLMAPQTVNCQYNPILNDVSIYAGYLQGTGAYNKDASYEQNLGKLRIVIGHEISHAFDVNGSQYDAEMRPTGGQRRTRRRLPRFARMWSISMTGRRRPPVS